METFGIRVLIGSVPIDAVTFAQAFEKIESESYEKPSVGKYVVFANAKTVNDASSNDDYLDLLENSWLNMPDGHPIAWLVHKKLRNGQRRIPGPDMFNRFMEKPNPQNRHFLVGATQDTLDKIVETSSSNIVGVWAPPICDDKNFSYAYLESRVQETSPTHIWVGLGSPKQDFISMKIAQKSNAVVLGVGAAFDFRAGRMKRAPRFVQELGLEWLYRLISEPRRLWKRYLVGNAMFVRHVYRNFK